MKISYFPRIRVVTASGGDEFEKKLNATLEDLARRGKKVEITFNLTVGHCAYVKFDEIHKTPETIADEYELRGERYTCRECPHYVPSMDGRTKYSRCTIMDERTTAKSDACEWFYKRLAKGELRPVED